MNTRCTAVIFDMDGLMLDTESIARRASIKAASDLGYRIPDSLFIQLVGLNINGSTAILETELGKDFPTAVFFKKMHDYEDLHINQHGIPVKPGLVELINMLDQRSIAKGIGTSTKKLKAVEKLKIAGLRDSFEHIVGGDEVKEGKPAPHLFLKVAERLGANPANCLVLEDSEPGIRAAHFAGMMPVMIPDLKQPSPEIKKLAYRVFPSLFEAKELISTLI
ncbi:HAD family phosphatase [bacterium]|nr:HAD family phosphatase [bacterium]